MSLCKENRLIGNNKAKFEKMVGIPTIFYVKEGGRMIKVVMLEFGDNDMPVYNEVMEVVQRSQNYKNWSVQSEAVLSLPDMEIHQERRIVSYNEQEIRLTGKESDILCLLVANKGQLVTYEQIYYRVWGGNPTGAVTDAIGYHIRNLRKKLGLSSEHSRFAIQCTREVGYCFQIKEGVTL